VTAEQPNDCTYRCTWCGATVDEWTDIHCADGEIERVPVTAQPLDLSPILRDVRDGWAPMPTAHDPSAGLISDRQAVVRILDRHVIDMTREIAGLRGAVTEANAALARVRAECDEMDTEVFGRHPLATRGMNEATARIRAAIEEPTQ